MCSRAGDENSGSSTAPNVTVFAISGFTASEPDDKPMLFDPMADKIYRHPTFYRLPDEVNHM